jgi:predicted O-methyltransferase YrrM
MSTTTSKPLPIMKYSLIKDPELVHYVQNRIQEHPSQIYAREQTEKHFADVAYLQSTSEEIQLICIMLKLMNAKKCIEIGMSQ